MEAATESTTLRYEKRRQDVVIERLWQTTATRIYDYIYDIMYVVLNGRTAKELLENTRASRHSHNTIGWSRYEDRWRFERVKPQDFRPHETMPSTAARVF